MEKVDLIFYPEEHVLDQRRNISKPMIYAKCDKCGYIHTIGEICLNKKRKPATLRAKIDATQYPLIKFRILPYIKPLSPSMGIMGDDILTGNEELTFFDGGKMWEDFDYQPWDVGTLNGR